MNIPEHFIRRPVMTTLITAAVTLFGWMAYQKLPVSELPNVDFPTISISASLPGASPETMAASVATPLEQQLSSIAGIDSMTSTKEPVGEYNAKPGADPICNDKEEILVLRNIRQPDEGDDSAERSKNQRNQSSS